jgi:hypothetical protein
MGGVFPEGLAELDALLGKVALLGSLLVRGASSLGAPVGSVLQGLTPEKLGLPKQARTSADWELIRGGLFYAADDLDKAHAIFQEIHSSEGSYWHGMLHRREGDFPNAIYWMRRAGRVAGLSGLADFSPIAFVQQCELAAGRGAEPQHLLETQRREWEAMMQWSWGRLEAAD